MDKKYDKAIECIRADMHIDAKIYVDDIRLSRVNDAEKCRLGSAYVDGWKDCMKYLAKMPWDEAMYVIYDDARKRLGYEK